MNDRRTFARNAVCMTGGVLVKDLMYAWGNPFAGLEVCMDGQHWFENAVCTNACSVWDMSADCMTRDHLLAMLCAWQEEYL